MPGAVPLTSSQALNNATLPIGLALANAGLAAVLENLALRAGLNVYRGRLTYKAVDESLGLFLLTDRTGCGMILGTLRDVFSQTWASHQSGTFCLPSMKGSLEVEVRHPAW